MQRPEFESYARRTNSWGAMQGACCPKCGQSRCGCECRKEARFVLAANQQTGTRTQLPAGMAQFLKENLADSEIDISDTNGAFASDFIGGDCCVSLSVECAATTSTAAFLVLVYVIDSDGTVLLWGRVEKAGTTYRVHDCIITTKPGAKLFVAAINCTARVRWCEVFSC